MAKNFIKDYKTINFLNDLGVDFKIGRSGVKNYILNTISDYELKIYHHNILKMPISLYDVEGVKKILYNNFLNDLALIKEDEMQLVSDEKFKELKNINSLIYLTVIAMILMLVCLVSIIKMYLEVGGF